jgi:hypothetical protein
MKGRCGCPTMENSAVGHFGRLRRLRRIVAEETPNKEAYQCASKKVRDPSTPGKKNRL